MSDPRVLSHRAGACPYPVVDHTAARVVVVDESGRVLLLHGRDPRHPERGDWWFTVGGGVEPGETLRAAALRELAEETGIRAADLTAELTGPLRRESEEFDLDGMHVVADNTYFAATVPVTDARPRALTDLEQRTLLGWRWWSLDELRATAEVVFPADLSALVETVLGVGTAP